MDKFTREHLKQYLADKYRNYESIYPLFIDYLEALDKDELNYFLNNGWNALRSAIENGPRREELIKLEFDNE